MEFTTEDQMFLRSIMVEPFFSTEELRQLQQEIENDKTTATLPEYQRAFDEVEFHYEIASLQRDREMKKSRALREELLGARAEVAHQKRRAVRLIAAIAAVAGIAAGSAIAFIMYRINLG